MEPLPFSRFVFSVAQVRRAEEVLLAAEQVPDQLMREAAGVVAAAAEVMLTEAAPPTAESDRILALVGAGGNGGDALYAGARLAAAGRPVDAVLLGREGVAHAPALADFRAAGGRVLEQLPLPQEYRLFLDGILGIKGRGGLAPAVAELLADGFTRRIPVLAIDVPSGIDADTGALPEPVRVSARGFAEAEAALRVQVVPAHVRADVTVTFGGLRGAHAVAHDCGEVIFADLVLPGAGESRSLGAELHRVFRADFRAGAPEVQLSRAWPGAGPRFDWAGSPVEFRGVCSPLGGLDLDPGAESDKYSGGVVGICAGSAAYRGAAVLCTTGAVRATSSLVRYVGEGWEEVVRALPEVIAHRDVRRAGRVQAWVVGPGRGTGGAARAELAQLLDRPEPLVIDADALTLLARHGSLRRRLRQRGARTLLTPHAGEFRRLADSVSAGIPDPAVDRMGAARTLAGELGCAVLLKGRRTVLAHGQRIHITDAGSSWGATAGSGDVLAGIAGAWLARQESLAAVWSAQHPEWDAAAVGSGYEDARTAIEVHAVAAALAARTPEGPAPVSASRIAAAIPRANAWLASPRGR